MKRSLENKFIEQVFGKLEEANSAFARRYPGDSPARQPVHTVYGGAHLFRSDSTVRLGQLALRSVEEYAPNSAVLARALQLPGYEELSDGKDSRLASKVYARMVEKLKREPVEDFRIDFEDGYGNRADDEEDHHAEFTAKEVAKGIVEKTLPPYIGIRIKPFTEELCGRSARTLDVFVSTLLAETGRKLPDNFVVTLPKVTIPEQVTAFVELLAALESKHNLAAETLKCELMIETTNAIINHRGEISLPALFQAAGSRCSGAHFGTYDYTASCSITASQQRMDHAACDFALSMMKVALGGTGIWLSDGATNVMPVGPHRAKEGESLTEAQKKENREVVHRAWKISYDNISHSLTNAFYQGWDLHPAQLPIRYAACYTFFLEGLDAASARLSAFMKKAAQATLLGDVFDDAATGQGLLNYFLRALNCGAITVDEVQATGLTLDEIRSRSFVKILAARVKRG